MIEELDFQSKINPILELKSETNRNINVISDLNILFLNLISEIGVEMNLISQIDLVEI